MRRKELPFCQMDETKNRNCSVKINFERRMHETRSRNNCDQTILGVVGIASPKHFKNCYHNCKEQQKCKFWRKHSDFVAIETETRVPNARLAKKTFLTSHSSAFSAKILNSGLVQFGKTEKLFLLAAIVRQANRKLCRIIRWESAGPVICPFLVAIAS